jgi:hypothetical protein
MWLLIDDSRNLMADVIARTPEAGKKMLALGGWEGVMFDHDLGDMAWPEETGYTILTWALEHNFVPGIVHLVSSNPVGVERMASALVNAGYTKSPSGVIFTKPVTPPHAPKT